MFANAGILGVLSWKNRLKIAQNIGCVDQEISESLGFLTGSQLKIVRKAPCFNSISGGFDGFIWQIDQRRRVIIHLRTGNRVDVVCFPQGAFRIAQC